MRLSKLIILGLVLSSSACLADTVHLKNGQTLQGDVKRSDNGYAVILPDGKRLEFKASEIESIEVGTSSKGTVPTDQLARTRLNSLRQGMESITNPAQAIERYKQFIQQYAGTSVIDDANADLAIWQDRLDRDLVRVGNQWITKQQRDQLQQQSLGKLAEARQLIRDGRPKEARPLLDQVLQADPENASAKYLRGCIQYQANQILDARRSFEAVNAAVPNHGPTLNNLAVIAGRQNALPAAMDYYDKAMIASPQDLFILANVAEALNAVPKDKQNNAAVQRAYRRFVEQDRQLQPIMARKEMYRWGSTYIPKGQYDRVQQQAAQVQTQLDSLAGEFQSVQDRIKRIDIQGEQNDRDMRQIEASRWYRDPNGKIINLPYPPVYAELQADNDKLKAERRDAVARLDQLRQQADAIRRTMPTPRYTGVQSMIGIEGTPVILSVTVSPPAIGPATDPATTLPAIPSTSPATAPATEPAPEPLDLNPMLPPATLPATTLPTTAPATLPAEIPTTLPAPATPSTQPTTAPSPTTQPASTQPAASSTTQPGA